MIERYKLNLNSLLQKLNKVNSNVQRNIKTRVEFIVDIAVFS